jgi:hypothetical protein
MGYPPKAALTAMSRRKKIEEGGGIVIPTG